MDLIDTNLVLELLKVRSGKAQQSVPLCYHPSRTGAGGAGGRKAGPNPGSPALHGSDPKPFRDGLIAATALVHSLVVLTRNLADSEATGVPLHNPWQQG